LKSALAADAISGRSTKTKVSKDALALTSLITLVHRNQPQAAASTIDGESVNASLTGPGASDHRFFQRRVQL
jgi:hypothetical protein